jgi:uncharacterized protein with LGFP repeats
MTEELFKKYVELGGGEVLGDPTGPEYVTGSGRYRDFHRGSIYWTPDTGACLVRGKILREWKDRGAESGVLGYPTNDETRIQDGSKIYSTFQGGTIYYLPQRDACDVSIGGRDSQFAVRIVGTIVAFAAWLLVAVLVALLSRGNPMLTIATGLLGPLTALLINLTWGKFINFDQS